MGATEIAGMDSGAFLRLLLATLIALIGGGIGVAFGGACRRLTPLVGIAGGALLAVTLVSLLPEAAHALRMPEFLLAVGSGYLLLYLVGRYIYPVCPACASSAAHHEHEHAHGECDTHSDHECGCGDDHCHDGDVHAGAGAAALAMGVRNTSVLLTVVLTLHSMVDGMAVVEAGAGAAPGTGHHPGHAALAMLLAVGLHKMPEGLALSALLLGAGMKPWRAFFTTAAVECTTLLGGLLGGLLLHAAPSHIVALALAHIGGGFLYLVGHGFLGGLFDGEKRPGMFPRRLGPQVIYGTLGFTCVALLLWSLGAAGAG